MTILKKIELDKGSVEDAIRKGTISNPGLSGKVDQFSKEVTRSGGEVYTNNQNGSADLPEIFVRARDQQHARDIIGKGVKASGLGDYIKQSSNGDTYTQKS